MGVTQTGAIFKGLIFDGIDSKNYGVYISGNAVFNAPERDVEMIAIPGRNGTFALDNGRFHNITITYQAGLFGDTEADFAEAISDFRNMLCARKGYCRLTDDYNPGEYRMAVYKSGLEVDVASLEAGQFDIVFECKPQRFLTSGETAVAVANNGTVINPTAFGSSPLLEVDGYGTIGVNANQIKVTIEPYGNVILYNQGISYGSNATITIDQNKYNVGNIITMLGNQLPNGSAMTLPIYSNSASKPITSVAITATPSDAIVTQESYTTDIGSTGVEICAYPKTTAFAAGSATNVAIQISAAITYDNNGTPTTETLVQKWTSSYNGSDRITITRQNTNTSSVLKMGGLFKQGQISVNSTKTATGVLYIDLDIGEAYTIDNGSVVSVNDSVELPADLPTLKPGANTITYNNTITSFKVTPRWWKV